VRLKDVRMLPPRKFGYPCFLLWCPSVVIAVLYATHEYRDTLIWKDFFQTQASFGRHWLFVQCFGLLVLILIAINVYLAACFVFLLFKKRWLLARQAILKLLMIMMIPFAAKLYADNMTRPTRGVVIQCLKSSFTRTGVDVQRIQRWLNGISIYEIDPLEPIVYDRKVTTKLLPEEIKECYEQLGPDVAFLRFSRDRGIYTILSWHSRLIDLGVVIGTGADSEIFPEDDEVFTLDLGDDAFVWLEM
jgi:hypothetical protein